MAEFKAAILSVNKRGKLFFFLSLILIAIVVAILVYFQVIPFYLQMFSIFIWLATVLKYVLQNKKQVLKKSVGELSISENEISILGALYPLAEITSIKIFISGWKSYQRSNDRLHPISDFHNGDKNFLTLVAAGKTTRCEFLLTSRGHWQQLREQVISWHRRKINLSETNASGRTYGLETLMYAEIQLFKKSVEASKISVP